MHILTEDQIERRVQAMVDRLDARFVRDCSMSQAEYDQRHIEIDQWASMQYRILDRWAPRLDGRQGRHVVR